MTRLLPLGLVLLLAAPAVGQTNWPAFRGGPLGNVGESKNLPDTWGTTENVAWKADVPGRGWSSPVVWGDRVFVTTVVSDGDSPSRQEGPVLRRRPGASRRPASTAGWSTASTSRPARSSGTKTVHKGKPADPHPHQEHLRLRDAGHRRRARLRLLRQRRRLLLRPRRQGAVVASAGPPSRRSWAGAPPPRRCCPRRPAVRRQRQRGEVVPRCPRRRRPARSCGRSIATRRATGRRRSSGRTTSAPRSSPAGTEQGALLRPRRQAAVGAAAACRVIAIPTPFAAARPAVRQLRLRHRPATRPRLRHQARGPAATSRLKGDETSNEFIAWCQKQAGPYHPSPLVYGDYLYVLLDRGFLSCYDAKTGKEVYDKQAPRRAGFTASPWAYDGKVFCLNEDGDTFVVQAGPEFKVLGKNRLDEMCLATPALARRQPVDPHADQTVSDRSGGEIGAALAAAC